MCRFIRRSHLKKPGTGKTVEHLLYPQAWQLAEYSGNQT